MSETETTNPNETPVTWRDSDKKWDKETGKKHVFRLRKLVVHWLEIEDVLFHHDSAVMMPDRLPGTGDQDRISGLSVIRASYMHAEDNPDQKLLVAGHTDTSGPDSYNETLSLQRAENVLHIILGEREPWVTLSRKKHKTEDIKQILTWIAAWKVWPCDPGGVNNSADKKMSDAVEAFQKEYKAAPFGEDISVDGIAGVETWRAFFTMYMERLKELTDSKNDGELAALRGKLHWLYADLKRVGGGEYHPIDEPYRDGYKSQTNRRVELLFYDPDEEPARKPGDICHTGGKAGAPDCVIYNPQIYDYIRVVPKDLEITKIDDHFAPSEEKIDITYRIEGLSDKTITLEIKSDHYSDNPIFTKELEAGEKADGTHTFQWDGKATCSAGDLKDQFIHPLYSPYKVRISDGGTNADTAEFKVLYHSLEIRQGFWTPDEAEPDKAAKEKDWVQYKLNELGYYGGPVGNDFSSYLKKAIIRYKANHIRMHELDYSDYDDSITAELKRALGANENKRDWLTGDAFKDPAKESKLLVEALTYEEGEFGKKKYDKESPRLNRPLVPVEVDIFLKKKDDSKAAAPKAVGPARVNWRFTDTDEDITKLHTTTAGVPSKTRKYVEKCLKLKSGRTGTNGDNCYKDYGGIRRTPANNWRTPVILGTKLEPWDLKRDDGEKVVYTKACTDQAKYAKRVGKAGFMFRPSKVAGDDYKIMAELDFTGLPNKADLEKFHNVTKVEERPSDETGNFRIWRFAKVAVSIDWPARSGSYQWAQVKDEFARAYLDVDVSAIQTLLPPNVISSTDYKKLVAKHTSHKEKNIQLLNNSFTGVKIPKQKTMSAAKYKTALNTFTNDEYYKKIRTPLREHISKVLRKTHPVGFIILNYLAHPPVNIKTNPPLNNTVTAANTNFITWVGSIGMADSVIILDQKDPDKVYYVVAHEMGHNFWILHWEHTGETNNDHHDTVDRNCLMSYSSSTCAHAHHRPGTYTPHLCGKCNLNLRGWKIHHAGVPNNST